MRLLKFLCCISLLAGLTACNLPQDQKKVPLEDLTPDEIFALADSKLTGEIVDYDEAIRLLDEIERLYPYSEVAKKALRQQTIIHHMQKDFEKSRRAAQRFLSIYASDPSAGEIQFIYALSYYEQITEIGRDQHKMERALESLTEVFERYPESEYAKSARVKHNLVLNYLAAKEMEIGRYYLKAGHYIAAIGRFRVVLEKYPRTRQTPEALHRLVEAFLSLGMKDEAQTAGAILGYNFQASEFYAESYKLLTGKGLSAKVKGNSWVAQIYRQVIKGEWL